MNTRIILRVAALAVCLLAPLTSAQAQFVKNGAYFCTSEVAGGIKYDEQTKKWRGQALRSDEKFVVRLRFIRTRMENISGLDRLVQHYDVTITMAGTNNALPCVSEGMLYVRMRDNEWLKCHIPLARPFDPYFTDYIINLKTNRFLWTYLTGFVEGRDAPGDTPAVGAGTCTKID